ncbi:MAG: TIGR02757 family protein [Deltaproteobacteria bacterium]|nr:TIGR02757 family protein [Deltaproteobacteria bacterium]
MSRTDTDPTDTDLTDTDLGPFLEAVYQRFHNADSVADDPLSVPTAYSDALDREVMGFIAAAFAFGRVQAFMAKLACLRDRLGQSPASRIAGLDEKGCMAVGSGIRHRFVGEGETASLLHGIACLLRRDGGLKPSFDRGLCTNGNIVDGLESLLFGIWPADIETSLPGPGFLLASVRAGSPLKRLNMFLRWMVRDDGIDLGLWTNVPTGSLIIPLDTHVFRIARFLGLLPTRRSGPRLKDAIQLTDALRRYDREDPVRFDFALSHLGISGGCRGRFHETTCPNCPLSPVCRESQVGH